jgi:putative redox protein
MDVRVKWDCAMLFRGCTPEATSIMMDAHPEHGGTNAGPTPMDTLLMALAGCTGMDVIAILKKMRAPVERFAINVHAERAADPPRVLTKIHLRYVASGQGLDAAQVRRAVALSLDRYCSISAMLRNALALTHDVVVEDGAAEESEKIQAAPAA